MIIWKCKFGLILIKCFNCPYRITSKQLRINYNTPSDTISLISYYPTSPSPSAQKKEKERSMGRTKFASLINFPVMISLPGLRTLSGDAVQW
jgi:hypothetical protein